MCVSSYLVVNVRLLLSTAVTAQKVKVGEQGEFTLHSTKWLPYGRMNEGMMLSRETKNAGLFARVVAKVAVCAA